MSMCMCKTDRQIKGNAGFRMDAKLEKRLIRSELKVTIHIQSTTDMTVRVQRHLQRKMWLDNYLQHHGD